MYSSFASHGVFVSTTEPFSISAPMTSAAARGGGASTLLAMHRVRALAAPALQPCSLHHTLVSCERLCPHTIVLDV